MTNEMFPDQKFVEFVVKEMVDFPDDVKVTRTVDELGVLIELEVNKEDIGKIIGKGGQTIKALRILLRVVGSQNQGSRVNLRLIDSE